MKKNTELVKADTKSGWAVRRVYRGDAWYDSGSSPPPDRDRDSGAPPRDHVRITEKHLPEKYRAEFKSLSMVDRKRFLRDVAIYGAYRNGLTIRQLSRAFFLKKTVILSICQRMRKRS